MKKINHLGVRISMINMQQGQIRVGSFGPIVVGEQPPENAQAVQQESAKVVCKHRQRPDVRRLHINRNRKGIHKQKMRASLFGPIVIEGQIIEESQITRQESTRFEQSST